MNGKRMDAAREFAGKRRVDHAMALKAGPTFEGFRYDIDAEMALPAGPMAGMAFVLVGFVLDPQAFGIESCGQPFRDEIAGSHLLRLAAEAPEGQCRIGAGDKNCFARRHLLVSLSRLEEQRVAST
jgi:hypothetical protein